MGGKVFTSGPKALFTPRLARDVYNHARAHCVAALRPLFPLLRSPIEAPGKTSFGDIDILASLEGSSLTSTSATSADATTASKTTTTTTSKDPDTVAVWAAVASALRAVRTHQENPLVMNVAMPWPPGVGGLIMARQRALEEAAAEAAGSSARGEAACGGDKTVTVGGEAEPRARFVQVDIHLCATKKELEWKYFNSAHGDFWGILGTVLRPYGLTISETALFIRVPEIEQVNKKKARVFLTDKPAEVLDFLGLASDNGQWERPFTSVDALFKYAATSRWFILDPKLVHDSVAAAARRGLKSNERRRVQQRDIFARWIDEFLPACVASGRFVAGPGYDPDSVREQVRAAAFRTFPGAQQAYDAHLAAWDAERSRIHVKNTLIRTDVCLPPSIAHVLPAPREGSGATAEYIETTWRSVLRSALVRIIVDGEDEFEGIRAPRLRDEKGMLRSEEVREWIAANWEVVGRAAWRLNCARASESYRIREERRAARAAIEKKAVANDGGGGGGGGGGDGASQTNDGDSSDPVESLRT